MSVAFYQWPSDINKPPMAHYYCRRHGRSALNDFSNCLIIAVDLPGN